MRKIKFLLLICSILITSIFSLESTAKANNISTIHDGGGGKLSSSSEFLDLSLSGFSCGEPLIGDETYALLSEFKEKEANMAEKFLVEQAEAVWQVGPVNSMNSLIFGNPYCVWAGSGANMSADGIFTVEEREKVLEPMLKIFSGLFVFLLVLSMLISGMKLSLGGISGRALAMFGEDLKMWGLSAIFVMCYGMFLNLIFQMNAALVLTIRDLVSGADISLMQSSMMNDNSGINVLSFVIVTFAEWVLSLILNFIYIARKVIITLLVIMGYLAAYSLLYTKTRAFFGVWLKELIGNVFIQSIHAIIWFAMIQFTAAGAGMFFKMGLLLMFIPISGMISKWLNFGDSSTKLGNAVTMMGFGGAMSTFMLASQAGNVMKGASIYNGGGVMNTSASGGDAANVLSQAGNMSTLANAVHNDSASTAITADATGSNSSTWNSAKNTVSKAAGTVGGIAGMVAGPMGSVAGYKIAETVAGGIMQAGRNVPMGITNAINQFSNAKQYTNAQGESGFKAMMGDPGARRQFFGNVGESLGSTVFLGGAGRAIGQAFSGVSRQALMQNVASKFNMTDANGNIMPATFQNLAAQYPGADVKYVQTNMGSGFYVNQGGEWVQVGASGAGDTSLKAGEMRMMDYKLADQVANDYKLQPNGSYTATPKSESDIAQLAATSPNLQASLMSNQQVAENGAPKANPIEMAGAASNIGNMQSAMQSPLVSNTSNVDMNPLEMAGTTSTIDQVQASADSTVESSSASGTTTIDSSSSSESGQNASPFTAVVGATSTNGSNDVPLNRTSPLNQATAQSSVENLVGRNTQNQGTSIPVNAQSIGSLPPLSNSPVSQQSGARTQSTKSARPELSGLQGSSPHLMRTSDAYIVNPTTSSVGATGNGTRQTVNPVSYSMNSGHMTSDAINAAIQPTTQRYADASFRANAVNPDAYVYHNATNEPTRTGTDAVADKVNQASTVRQTWAQKFQQQKEEKRLRKIR